MTSPERIEAAFSRSVERLDGIGSAFDHEPKKLGRLPCVTMLFSRFTQDESEIGTTAADVLWEWDVYVNVRLADFREAQRELRDLVAALIGLPRADEHLLDSCDEWRLLDEGDQPIFGVDEGLLRKRLRLHAWTREP